MITFVKEFLRIVTDWKIQSKVAMEQHNSVPSVCAFVLVFVFAHSYVHICGHTCEHKHIFAGILSPKWGKCL